MGFFLAGLAVAREHCDGRGGFPVKFSFVERTSSLRVGQRLLAYLPLLPIRFRMCIADNQQSGDARADRPSPKARSQQPLPRKRRTTVEKIFSGARLACLVKNTEHFVSEPLAESARVEGDQHSIEEAAH